MGLIENNGIAGRQQFGNAFIAQHYIGKKQVMINDDEISFHRLAPCGQDKAFFVMRAILAKAVIAR